MNQRTPVDVAVGVLIRPDRRFLLASRPPGKPYAGYWEFPGGKLEAGESVEHALARELHEELSIDIGAVNRWMVRVFDYPHAKVRLHFCRVFTWSGELAAREAQDYGFFALDDLPDPLLPATLPMLRWLALPAEYAISAATLLGPDVFLHRLDAALAHGLKLLQLREPGMAEARFAQLFEAVLGRVRHSGAMLLVNSGHPSQYWQRADGVHLRAADLKASTRRPNASWVAASVHNLDELRSACDLPVDFVVAGPVRVTASHPGRAPMGWPAFSRLSAASSVPVFALGGLRATDLGTALNHGAHGVAMLSAPWNDDQCRVSSGSSSGVSVDVPDIE